MSSVKHTPSEWLIAGCDEKTFVYALNDQGYNRFSANVQMGHVAPMERTPLAELEANARLIAAAPDLLNELINLSVRFKAAAIQAGTDEEFAELAIAGALAAIAKATGSAQ